MKLPVFKPRERRHLLLSPVVCFYKGQIPPNAPGGGGGLTTFDRLLSPNQGRFALIKVKSPTSPQAGGGGGGGGGGSHVTMIGALDRNCYRGGYRILANGAVADPGFWDGWSTASSPAPVAPEALPQKLFNI